MGGVGSGGSKPRKPNHLRALEGQREDRLNRNEPIPGELPVRPAVELDDAAQAVWDRLAPDMIAKRVLTCWDVDLFAAFCESVALYNEARAEVMKTGTSTDRPYKGSVVSPAFRVMQNSLDNMRSLAARFGLSPADRASLKVDDGGQHSGTQAYVV